VRKLCQQGFLKVDKPVRAEAEHVAGLRLQQAPQPAGPADLRILGSGLGLGFGSGLEQAGTYGFELNVGRWRQGDEQVHGYLHLEET